MNQAQLAHEMEQLLLLRINRICVKIKNLPKDNPKYEEFKAHFLHIQSQLEEQYYSFLS